MRTKLMFVACLTLVLVVPAFAHEDFRIIGTILKVTPKLIDVKQTKDGKTISMATDMATPVTRDDAKVSRSELKVGTNVVVDATGDSLEELFVVQVRIVPAAAK